MPLRMPLLLLILSLALGFTAPGSGSARAQSMPPLAAPAEAGAFDCVVKPSMEVHVSASIGGVLDEVNVDRGTLVRRGDVIARLNSDVEKSAVALALRRSEASTKIDASRARLTYLQRDYDRKRRLNETRVVSDGALDETLTQMTVAQRELQEAEFDAGTAKLEYDRALILLKQRTIFSPIDGVVVERSLAPGEFWREDQSIATIAAVNPLYVETFVPVRFSGRLAVGDVATVAPEEPETARYEAVVDVVDRVYDAASGTFGVRLKLGNPDMTIPAGLRCRITFPSVVAGN